MALVSDGFRGTVTLRDTSGSVSNLEYELTAADMTAALADMLTVTAALADMTDSVIQTYTVAEVFREDAFALPVNAENAIKASISAYLDVLGQEVANIKVPAPVIDAFVSNTGPGYNQVADVGIVQAYLDLYETTGGVATISGGKTLRDTGNFAGGKRISRGSQNP